MTGSDDLVKRLRMRAVPIGTCDEAAAEIERLRKFVDPRHRYPEAVSDDRN